MPQPRVTGFARRAGRFWRRFAASAFPALLAATVVAFLVNLTGLSRPLARRVYDLQLRMRTASPWPEDLVVAPIDDAVVGALGRWPWPRRRTAEVVERLKALGAKTIVVDVFFLGETRDDAALARALDGAVIPLAASGSGLEPGETAWLEPSLLPIPAAVLPTWPGLRVAEPIGPFARRKGRYAHAQLFRQPDGMLRSYSPLLPVEGVRDLVPSLALAALLEHEGIPASAVRFDRRRLKIGELRSFSLSAGELALDFAPAHDAPPGMPGGPARAGLETILDPAHERAMRTALEGKLVLVYVEASSVDRESTPVSNETAGGLVHAYAIRTLAAGRAPRAVPLVPAFGALALVVLALSPWLQRRSFSTVLGVFAALIAGYVALSLSIVRGWDLFLPVAMPVPFLAFAGIFLAGRAHYALRRAHDRSASRLRSAPASGDAFRAPNGRVCLVFTDIEGSTTLWQNAYGAMRTALDLHDHTVRRALEEFGGYEVKTDGDAFMVAFSSAPQAIRWALAVQERLMTCDWPEPVLLEPEAATVFGDGRRPVLRGLRVRMGVHVGGTEARANPLTGRMDYFGPTVNRTARLAGAAHGGQILVTEEVAEEVRPLLADLGGPVLEALGQFELKGFEEPIQLFQVLPFSLVTRRFDRPRAPEARGNF